MTHFGGCTTTFVNHICQQHLSPIKDYCCDHSQNQILEVQSPVWDHDTGSWHPESTRFNSTFDLKTAQADTCSQAGFHDGISSFINGFQEITSLVPPEICQNANLNFAWNGCACTNGTFRHFATGDCVQAADCSSLMAQERPSTGKRC